MRYSCTEARTVSARGFLTAAGALGEKGHQNAFQPLIKALDDGSEELTVAAVEALGKLGDRSAVAPLVGLLKNKSETIRGVAMKAV